MIELSAGTVVDRYTIEATIGSGGMATVYRARHNQIGSLHAVKVLAVPSPAIRERLLQEGRVQGTMRHRNIVAVTDVVSLEGAPALVMEYVRGPSLHGLLKALRPRLEQADALARGLLKGVAAAHKRELIHRDLKPANVLIALEEDWLVPKIADFGLAKILSGDPASGSTRSGVAMGTPAYMAPEQIRDSKDVDARADVWSLGCILYELVTGSRPFEGSDTMQIFQAVCNGDYPSVANVEPPLPARMVRAIEGALQVDAGQRFADAGALLEAWTGASSGERAQLSGDSWNDAEIELARSLGSGGEESLTSGGPSGTSDPTFALEHPEPTPETVDFGADSIAPPESADSIAHTGERRPVDWKRVGIWFAAGTGLAAPFNDGIVIAVAGSLEQAMNAGPAVIALLCLGPLAVGVTAALCKLHEYGYGDKLAAWLAMPALIMLTGGIGTGTGAGAVQAAVADLPPGERAAMISHGLTEALTLAVLSFTMASLAMLGVAGLSAWHYRFRLHKGGVESNRPAVAALLGVFAGWMVWAWHEWTAAAGPGPFAVYLAVVVGACALAAVAIPLPQKHQKSATRDKLLVTFSTIAAVHAAAEAVELQRLLWHFSQIADAAAADRMMAAEAFAAWAHVGSAGRVVSWVAVIALVALAAWYKVHTGGLNGLTAKRQFGPFLPIAAALIGGYYFAMTSVDQAAMQIVPGFQAEATQLYLGVQLADGDDGVTVIDESAPWQTGDGLNAINSRPVRDVGTLIHDLHACLCEGEAQAPCALGDTCLQPGATLEVQVLRDGRLQTISVDLGLGG